MIDPKGIGNIEKACSDDELRPAMMGVHVDAEKKRIIATNGRILVIYPLSPEEYDEQFTQSVTMPSALFAEWRKLSKKGKVASPIAIMENDSVLQNNCHFPHIEEQYPNVDSVIPQQSVGRPIAFEIGLNAELLKQLLASLRGTKLKFTFFSPHHAVLVTPQDTEEKGLIMPFRLGS